jgi:hypothetical protein
MTRFPLRPSLVVTALLFAACDDDEGPLSFPDSGAAAPFVSSVPVVPAECPPFGVPLPKTLSCTGLYGTAGAGPVEKAIHPQNREFAPGTTLWTDGADKHRWIALPPGAKIDSSDPNGWVFPDGTRVWKEFAFQGKRAETRLMYKFQGTWIFASYQWNDTDTEAVAVSEAGGASVPLADGRVHSIPTNEECNTCHRGSRDKLLGFQQVLLGLPGAKGLTLATLAAENLLSAPPAKTSYVIPDDGTGMSAQVLSYIHVNCGVSCHNESPNAYAQSSRMFLRIDPAQMEAATPADWNIVKQTVGVTSMTANFKGVRIIPGSPDESLIVQLFKTRGNNNAMPPLGTRVVDADGLALIREWITRLGGAKPDAGVEMDSGVVMDAATADADAPPSDGADIDADSTDAEVVDAGLPDADVPPVPEPDADVPPVPEPDADVPPVPEVPDAEAPVPAVPDADVPAVPEVPDAYVPPVPESPGAGEPPVPQVPDAGDSDAEVPDAAVPATTVDP